MLFVLKIKGIFEKKNPTQNGFFFLKIQLKRVEKGSFLYI